MNSEHTTVFSDVSATTSNHDVWNMTSEHDAWNMTLNAMTSNVTGTPESQVPDGCIVFQWNAMEYVPWDNDQMLVTPETEQIVRRVKDVAIIPLTFLFGFPGNLINMAVFYKQGLKERVNVCLFSLSLADGLYLLYVFIMYGEQLYLQFTTQERYGPVMSFLLNYNISTLFGLGWVSQILSAIISSERCLCVMSPLKSQMLLRTRTMVWIIGFIYVSVLAMYFVVVFKYRIGCYYEPISGTTFQNSVVGEFYREHSTLIENLDTFVYGAGITIGACIVVMITTTITAMKIRQAAVWRVKTSSSAAANDHSEVAIPAREVALTRMLIGVSILFLACVLPIALLRFVWLFMDEIRFNRRQQNLFLTTIWVLEALSYINSAFNIIVYYTMGSRYRETFWELFRQRSQDTKHKSEPFTVTSNI